MGKYIDVSNILPGTTKLKLDDLNGFNRAMTSLNPSQLGLLNIGIKGHWCFVWTKMPPFMEARLTQLTKNFKIYSHMCASNFTGIPDLTLEKADVKFGRNEHTMSRGIQSKFEGNTFTYDLPELQDRTVLKFMTHWIQGISDTQSGRATHLGELDDGKLRDARNETGEILYFNMTSDFNEVTDAFYITNIYPTKANVSQNNGDGIGDIKTTCEFEGHIIFGNEDVNKKAKTMLSQLQTLRTVQFDGKVFEG